jgi:WD40 repeat protein
VADDQLSILREIDCPEAISPRCTVKRDGSLVSVVGAKGYLGVDNGSETNTTHLNDEFFKQVCFYGSDESSVICLSRHTLALVDCQRLQTTCALYGSTQTAVGTLRKSLNCLATHPNQPLVAVGTVTGYVEFYDLSREGQEKVTDIKIGGQLIERMEFSADGQTLAIAASNRKALLMDMSTKTVTSSIDPQRSRVLSVSFNKSMDKLVMVSEDKTVVVAPVIDIEK